MREARVRIEVVSMDYPEELKPSVYPLLKAIIQAEEPYSEELAVCWQKLYEWGISDQGRLLISPQCLLEALTHVSMEEEVNRAGQF